MADKSGHVTAGRALKADRPANIRNIALVGHSGVGKTTLVEALLRSSGTIARAGRVEEGNTVSDFDEVEIRQKRSINLTLAPMMVGDVKVNLLDTPGYADFVGDLRAGLRGADAALFVVSAIDGVDDRTRLAWEECASIGMPRAVAVSKIDHPRADFFGTVKQCRAVFGDGVLPAYLPALTGEEESRGVRGLAGLLSRRYHEYTDHTTEGRREARVPDDLAEEMAPFRSELIEGVIQESEDETLMERYVSGEELAPETLITDLEAAVARGGFHPVIPVSAIVGVGVAELLEELPRACPAPTERSLPPVAATDGGTAEVTPRCDPDAPLLAEVLKTVNDPYVGRVSLVRVFSGTLRPDTVVRVCGQGMGDRGHEDHEVDERVGTLSIPLGNRTQPCGEIIAGDICAAAKLSHAEIGDTLSAPDTPLRIPPWRFPDPLLPLALRPASKSDEDRMSQAVSRLSAEDMTLRIEVNPETHQMVLWCMGEAHLDVILDRLASRNNLNVETEEVRVPLRETFTEPVRGWGRNVKQTGGHGEYGVCEIKVEPLPRGAGFEFVDAIVGGVIPRQYIPSVEKGLRAQMAQGVGSGHPLVDLRITLADGKSHSVDSSDMAFQKAAKLALRDAASRTRLAMLEPIVELSIIVADDYVGAVMGDLSARRGRVNGSEPVGGGRTMVKAEVPELEVSRYAVDLRSLAHGTGTFSRRYLRHERLPEHLAAKYRESAS